MDANLNYRTSSARAASGVGIVILLYEQLVHDLRRAGAAIDEGDVEARTLELGHALEVVGQLQGRLDMENGRDVAQNLDRFYTSLQAGILDAQFKAAKPQVERLIENVLSIREAWLSVEQATTSGAAAAEASAVATQAPESDPQPVTRNWRV